MLIDTHCHLYLKDLDTELPEVLHRAEEAGVTRMICPAIGIETAHTALNLANLYENIYAAAGIHPNYTSDLPEDYLDQLKPFFSEKKVVAVGEIGLDYYWDYALPEIQKKRFAEQVELAKSIDLPIIVHNRDADADVIEILKSVGHNRGVAHCFSSDYLTAKAFLDLGFYISFAGNLTFKNTNLRDIAKAIPLEMTLVETDSPFLSPMPFRGKRNEPARTKLIAEELAKVYHTTFEEIAQKTTENARNLFKL
ncbi:MAG: TatD family hydrolase [Candidatus Marinimicrobia bacterium]|nr:TatD family hydrolase [Candidatus Neomarinimicrobiota bacterium]